MTLRPLIATALAVLPSCVVPDGAEARWDQNLLVASQYNHRGMPMNDKGVLQTDLSSVVPTKADGTLVVRGFANIDLDDDTGDAWFPNGHGLEVTEIDLSARWSKQFGKNTLNAGFISYWLANGEEFGDGPTVSPALTPRGETRELFVGVARELLTVQTALVFNFDIDEVNGWYINASGQKQWQLADKLFYNLRGAFGFNDDKHAVWTYGAPDGGGLADFRLLNSLEYDWNESTVLYGRVGYSTILGSEIADWMDLIGVDTENVWLVLGAGWSY